MFFEFNWFHVPFARTFPQIKHCGFCVPSRSVINVKPNNTYELLYFLFSDINILNIKMLNKNKNKGMRKLE